MYKMELKINEKPDLKVCKMICDKPLHKKLDKYELTAYMNQHSTNLLIGKPKSGKTSLLYSFFKSRELFYGVFHNIYLFQPSNSRNSMKDKLFDEIPENQCYEELDYDSLNCVMNEIKNEDPKYNNCIIMDDCTASLKNPETLKLFKELIFNRRHLRTSIYFLVQTWYSVPKEIRRLFSNIFVFRVAKQELENIFSEVVEQKKEYIPQIVKLVYDVPYNFLFINTDSQRIYRNWDEIIVKS